MKSKRWGFAAVAAAIIATFCVLGAPAAHADPTGPTVTSVDRSGSAPVVHIDWASYADAPVGVVESVDGYKLGTPGEMTTVTDDWSTSPGLRSYRAAACYARCDLDSIKSGQATLVQGDWLRPDVGDPSGQSGPDLELTWYEPAFSVGWQAPSVPAPAVGVYRNGVPIAVELTDTWGYTDNGPFESSETYSATGCYADCTVSALASGFALQTPAGSPQHIDAATSGISTYTLFSCPAANDFIPDPLLVGVSTTCRAWVRDTEFTLMPPTGLVEFRSDDDGLLPPASCELQDGQCVISLTPPADAVGTHNLTSSYQGDDAHDGSSFSWPVPVVIGFTATAVDCPSTAHPGETVHCAITVTDTTSATSVPTGTVEVDSGAFLPRTQCSLDVGTCSVDIALPGNLVGGFRVFAQYRPDDGHWYSAGVAGLTVVPGAPSSTSIACQSTIYVLNTMACTVRVVSASDPAAASPTGVVRFAFDRGGIPNMECTLVQGWCTIALTTPKDARGVVVVTAVYGGDPGFETSLASASVTVVEPTRLVAKPAIANLVSPTKVNLAMSATLTDDLDHSPIAGETIRFAVNGTTLCTGVTDASGVATCSGLTEVVQAANGYKAFFDGNVTTYRLRSSTSGAGVRL